MPEISFCPQTLAQLDGLLKKGLFSGYGLVLFPQEATDTLRAEFVSLPVVVALKAKFLHSVPPDLSLYTFGLDPFEEGTQLHLALEPARPCLDNDALEFAVGFPMKVEVRRPPQSQAAQAS